MLLQRFRDRHEQHAGLGQFGLERGRHRNRVEYRVHGHAAVAAAGLRFAAVGVLACGLRVLHAEEDFLLAQRDAELLVGAQDFRIDFVKRFRSVLLLRRRVVVNVLVVDRAVFDLGPFRLAHGQPAFVGIEPPRQHPVRFVLFRRNEAHDIFGQALRGLFRFNQRLKSVFVLIDVDAPDLLDGLLHCRHSSLRSRGQGPRVGFSRYGQVGLSLRFTPIGPDRGHDVRLIACYFRRLNGLIHLVRAVIRLQFLVAP